MAKLWEGESELILERFSVADESLINASLVFIIIIKLLCNRNCEINFQRKI